ncbi:MAG: hypothetical protein ACKOSQ_06815 [Planctomycetaceae bacterium]
MRLPSTAACLCVAVLTCVRADAQLRITEEVSLTGTVEAVAAGVVTVRDERQGRVEVRVQGPGAKGVALADGRMLEFPSEVRVTGGIAARQVTAGQVVRFRATMNGAGKGAGEVATVTVGDVPADVGATWPAGPPPAGAFAPCEIVAPLKNLLAARIAVELPAGKPFPKAVVVSFPLAKEAVFEMSSADPRKIVAGARVVSLEAVRLDSGDVIARRLVAENPGGAVATDGDAALERRFAKLSAEPKAAAREVRSKHFAFLTDVSDREWAIIEHKLERMVGRLEVYFGRQPQGLVQGFIARDLGAFPPGALADPRGVEKIRRGEGVCMCSSLGPQRRAELYSCADHGVIQHECAHGFCHLTFGSTGPTWLSEGFAELANYWKDGETAVDIPPPVMGYLQKEPRRRRLTEIAVPGRTDPGTWQDYAWRWALCHLLASNPNYNDRFKPLAIQLMEGHPEASFESVYGPVAKEISFEYDQFLKAVGNGYRADLAAWPWRARFRPLPAGGKTDVRVKAKGGWQSGGVTVEKGTRYEIVAIGTWRTATVGPPLDGAGDGAGRGRLVAAVLIDGDGYDLTAEIPIGTRSGFEAPASGRLHFRCADDWTALADNDGELAVTISRP